MTYKDLLDRLQLVTEEQLKQDVTVVFDTDEFFRIKELSEILPLSNGSDILDAGHLVLEIE